MADPKAPEMAETFIDDLAFLLRVPVAEIRRPVMGLLKARSLAIVSEADRKVLEALKADLEGPKPSIEECPHCKRRPCAWFAVCAEAAWRRR